MYGSQSWNALTAGRSQLTIQPVNWQVSGTCLLPSIVLQPHLALVYELPFGGQRDSGRTLVYVGHFHYILIPEIQMANGTASTPSTPSRTCAAMFTSHLRTRYLSHPSKLMLTMSKRGTVHGGPVHALHGRKVQGDG